MRLLWVILMTLLEASAPSPRESASADVPVAGRSVVTGASTWVAADAPGDEPRRYTPEDVLLALASATPRVRCLVTLEIGGAGFDPYARGSLGEEGPAQLLSPLREEFFRRMGPGSDLHSPFQVIPFMEALVSEGRGSNWSGWGKCKWMS